MLDVYFPYQIVEADWVHNIPAYFIIIVRLHTDFLHGKRSTNHWRCLLREVTLSISKEAPIWLSVLKSLMGLRYLSAGVLLFASTAHAFPPPLLSSNTAVLICQSHISNPYLFPLFLGLIWQTEGDETSLIITKREALEVCLRPVSQGCRHVL